MIYVLTEERDESVVKIGYTKTSGEKADRAAALKRISNIQANTWRDLKCVAMLDGSRRDELLLHRRFAAFHVRGEWFRASTEVTDWLNEVGCVGFRRLARDRSFEVKPQVQQRTPFVLNDLRATARKYLRITSDYDI